MNVYAIKQARDSAAGKTYPIMGCVLAGETKKGLLYFLAVRNSALEIPLMIKGNEVNVLDDVSLFPDIDYKSAARHKWSQAATLERDNGTLLIF